MEDISIAGMIMKVSDGCCSRTVVCIHLIALRWNSISTCNLVIAVGVDSSAANKVVDFIRENFVNGDASSMEIGESGIKLTNAVEFRCVPLFH
jgi:hypothetical protein